MLRINLTRLNEIIFYIIGIILVITSLKSSLKTIIFFDNLRLVLIFSLFCLIPISLLKLKNDKTLIQNIFLLFITNKKVYRSS
jgi:hypothetical protein